MIERYIDGGWYQSRIEKVFHVSEMRKNLFSVEVCTSKDFEVVFRKNYIEIKDCGKVLHRHALQRKPKLATAAPGEVIHSDVYAAISVKSAGGARSFCLLKMMQAVYDLSIFCDIKVMFTKNSVFDKLLENKFGRTIRMFRSHNGREFRNKCMDRFFESREIQREFTAP